MSYNFTSLLTLHQIHIRVVSMDNVGTKHPLTDKQKTLRNYVQLICLLY